MGNKSHHLRLKNVAFWARHGHGKAERELGNRFEVDVDLEADLDRACAEDRLGLTVNLTDVYEVIRKHMEGDLRVLIETLAANIATELAGIAGVRAATVRVRKLNPPMTGLVKGIMEAEVTHVS